MTGSTIVNLENVDYIEKVDDYPPTPTIVLYFASGREKIEKFPNSNYKRRDEVWAVPDDIFYDA